jgi:hypothetical protein
MKQSSISLTQIKSGVLQFLHRYHVLLFVLTAIGGLSLATFMINQTINGPADTTIQSTNESFDKETMDKVKSLRKPDEAPAPLVLPEGRVNPFI